jgi:hypothetical protein
MNQHALASSLVTLALVAGCSAVDGADPPEESTDDTGAALTSGNASGVPWSVLVNYAFWNVSGPNIPADPPPWSGCASPLDAVTYHVIGCMDPQENPISPSVPNGVYCSANDGSGVTSLQAECLGGWLMTISAINGKRIPANVVLTGANKVASSVTEVVLLECPTPPAGLSQHNVIYKAVYNDGVFAPRIPAGCTTYSLAPK